MEATASTTCPICGASLTQSIPGDNGVWTCPSHGDFTGGTSLGGTAPIWARNGAPDWISRTDNTDRNFISVGCGMAYFSWMMSLGHGVGEIAQAGGATLSANYATLTGKSAGDAYANLIEALRSLPQAKSDPFRIWPDANPTDV